MTDTPDNQVSSTTDIMSDTPDSLSLAEAAAHLGVSERTILRRIEKGIIQGHKVDAERGHVWRVHLSGMPDMQDKLPAAVSDVTDNRLADMSDSQDGIPADVVPEVVRVIIDEMRQEYRERIAELEEKNERNVAAAAHWQARAADAERRAQHAEDQVKLLMAPKDEPAEETPAAPERVSWWKRLWR